MGSGVKHATLGNGTKVTDTVWAEDHAVTNVLPDTDATYDLGSTTVKWNNAWVLALRKLANIYPGTSEKFYINASDETPRAIWENLHQTSFTLKPNTNDTGTLGTAARVWGDIYCGQIRSKLGNIAAQTLFFDNTGVAFNPGDTNYHEIPSTRLYFPFDRALPTYGRVVSRTSADEAGTKYFKLLSSAGNINEAGWSGSGAKTFDGSWQTITETNNKEMWIEYKVSSATETLTVYSIAFQIGYF